ncbi:MAG: PhzF family phenazine biosynthesis protein [Planctomycetota bacterium]
MIRLYQIDAFTDRRFGGNPAAVVALEEWPSDDVMQSLAQENNLAETAFIGPPSSLGCDFLIRWFTPTVEVDLCGHATLASAHVLRRHLDWVGQRVVFDSRSGPLPVEFQQDDGYTLDFPSASPEPAPGIDLAVPMGLAPQEIRSAWAALAIYNDEAEVRSLVPDMAALVDTGLFGVIATAPGPGGDGPDFVSRFFAPAAGVPEDPATGSAHCILAPYWAARLGKSEMLAHQIHPRLGVFRVTDRGDRTLLSGSAVTVFQASLAEPL